MGSVSYFPLPEWFGAPAKATIRRSIIEQNEDWGIYIQCSEATIESTTVRDTIERTPGTGRAIDIHRSAGDAAEWNFLRRFTDYVDPPSNVTIRTSQLEKSHTFGIYIEGSNVALESSVVRDTMEGSFESFGKGINIEPHEHTSWPSNVTIHGSLVERSVMIGIDVLLSNATISETIIRDTAASPDGSYGDGLGVINSAAAPPNTVRLSAVTIESSARAGISNFGGAVEMGNTTIRCSAFDIHAESLGTTSFRLTDLGGNVCGCPEATNTCEVVGAEFTTPPPDGN
jgi:hypothetical protein